MNASIFMYHTPPSTHPPKNQLSDLKWKTEKYYGLKFGPHAAMIRDRTNAMSIKSWYQ